MEVKKGRRIQIECQSTDKAWNKKYVAIDDIINYINKKNKSFRELHKVNASVEPKIITKLFGELKGELIKEGKS